MHPPIEQIPGTPFQHKVWRALLTIPQGETRTYSEIAIQIGHPGAHRAVANACGQNKYAPEIPCHRVTATYNFGGYSAAGGVDRKIELLRAEGVDLSRFKLPKR